jgi:hypothetical protein
VTRDQIISDAFLRLSLPGNDAPRVAFAVRILNQLYTRVCRDHRLIMEFADLPVTAGEPLVDLPDDFLALETVREGPGVVHPITLREFLAGDAGFGARGYVFWPPKQLRVVPTPSSDDNAALRIYYVAAPAPLEVGTDEPESLPADYHELLVELLVHRLALAEEAPDLAMTAMQTATELQASLRFTLTNRAGASTDRIRRKVYD